jgi:two-component system sensor histidine kinase KdpD
MARLVIFLTSAPGAGKTHRLLEEARRLRSGGVDAMIGVADLKGRADLEAIAAQIPRIEPREGRFDFRATLIRQPDVVLLDELQRRNPFGSAHNTRWREALALRENGIGVIGAFNIAHLEPAAPVFESITGTKSNELIPLSFLQSADEVIALDVSPRLLQMRLRSGKIAQAGDIDVALENTFSEENLERLRQLLLRTIDNLTMPAVSAERLSTAAALLLDDVDPAPFLRRTSALSSALDLALEIIAPPAADFDQLSRIARDLDAEILKQNVDPAKIDMTQVRASLISIPAGPLATKLASRRMDRDFFIAGRGQTYIGDMPLVSHPYGMTAGDRMRVGYGKLAVYLGAAAGSGKTHAMLDRAQQLKDEGVDVVAGVVETHGRTEIEAMVRGLELLPRKEVTADGKSYAELDREALLARKPQVVLIDELAHTNAPGSAAAKRYEDVLAALRAGIDVITTLNVWHLEALSDAVFRLTGRAVRDTLPDGILALADEVILIDVSPETLRERLRGGHIYPKEKIESALSTFFRSENLLALRELALREALRARNRQKLPAPFERLLLSVASRPQDVALIERCSRIAARLEVEFAVAFVTEPNSKSVRLEAELKAAARNANATWIRRTGADIAAEVLRTAREVPETTIAVAGTLRTPAFMQRKTFARRLLDVGALELLILAPRAGELELRSELEPDA